MGNICRPATVGLDPRSTWKYCGSRDRAEHHHADHHGNDDALREDPVAEDTQRDDGGFAHPMLDVDKPCGAHHTGRVTGDGPPTAPAPFAALFGDDQQRDHAQRQEPGSRPVHPPAGASDLVVVQHAVDNHQGDETDRHVDEEHPTPAGHEQNRLLTGEQATEHGAHHTRGAEDGEEISLVLRPLARGHDVTDDGERQRHQAAGTEPLQRAVPRELIHRGRGGAQQRTDDEDRDGRHEQLLAAVHVRQLAVERGHDGGRDEIRGGHPRLQRIALQVIGNGADGIETMVWSSAARNIPSISPPRIVRIFLCDSSALPAGAEAGVSVNSVASPLEHRSMHLRHCRRTGPSTGSGCLCRRRANPTSTT